MRHIITLNDKSIIISGAAGFIGSNLATRLLKTYKGARIIGIDCLTDYNPIALKEYHLNQINNYAKNSSSSWEFIKIDIGDAAAVQMIFDKYSPHIVVNLAAQAGVRYSISNP